MHFELCIQPKITRFLHFVMILLWICTFLAMISNPPQSRYSHHSSDIHPNHWDIVHTVGGVVDLLH